MELSKKLLAIPKALQAASGQFCIQCLGKSDLTFSRVGLIRHCRANLPCSSAVKCHTPMPSWTGARGSSHRKAIICGLIAVGTAVLLLTGLMMESSVKQVYWAVYSRVHPMRGNSESYSKTPTCPFQLASGFTLSQSLYV